MAPPRPASPDELEALIREARAGQRRRWLAAAVAVALLAGAAIALDSIVAGGNPGTTLTGGGPTPAKSGNACGVRSEGVRLFDARGRTVYREPGRYVHPNSGPGAAIRCSGPTIWAVWDNGAGMSKEAYVGARSTDRGRSWKLVFTERFFGVKAPHELDAYMGPWILRGHLAYFTGWCPACGATSPFGSVSLSVTTDSGATFRRYEIPALNGYEPIGIRLSAGRVAVTAKGFFHGIWRRKTVTLRVG